jgi:hypothetical protein
MAKIVKGNIERLDKERNFVHKPVEATYSSFVEDGKKYFQIDTYGSQNRVSKGIANQKIQFTKETANYLIDVLNEEFNK